MESNKDYSHLLERIKGLNATIIERMSPDVMANLTDGFEEQLVREMLYTGNVNYEQRKIIKAVKTAYKNWKRSTDRYWGDLPLFPENYPQYMEELQMDIECGCVVTAKGTFCEASARLTISVIPSGAVPLKSFPKANQPTEQTVIDGTMNSNTHDADDKDKMIAELRKDKEELKKEAENAELKKQIDQQGVEDINLELEKLKAENEHLQVMNEALQKQNDRYESMAAPDVDLNEEEKLQIDERIIFFSSLLGCSLKSEVVVQTKFAELVQKMTGDDKESIRTRIVAMNTEIQKVDDGKVGNFSDGTLEAARNVYNLIDKAVKGMTRAVKPYQCKQAMENINKTFHLGIKM